MQNLRSFFSNKGGLTQGDLQNHLIRLAVPMTWGIMAIISFQLVDTFYVSLLGTQALAALSFTFPIGFLIFSLFMGFAIAMSSVVSRLIGGGNQEEVKRVTTHGLMLIFTLGVIISIIGYYTQDYIFKAMGADDEILPLIRDYMSIWFMGAVFITMPLVGNAAIRATGDTILPAMIMTIVAVVNIILDPILIFGLFGFPRMEIQGAAVATIFGNACAMIAGLYVLGVHKKLLCTFSTLRLDLFWNSIKRLLFIAIPVGIANSIQPAVNTVIISMLTAYGAEAVAAYGVVTRVEAFAFVILMGVAVGMGPIIGQNWGAGKIERVHATIRKAIIFSTVWSVFVAITLGVFAKPIASLFAENDPKVVEYAALFFWIVPFSYAFSNLIRGWGSAFNAMGMPQRSFIMIVVEMLVLMLPAVYIGNYFYGVTGMFMAMAAVNVVAGTLFHIWSWKTCLQHSRQKSQPEATDPL